MAALFNQDFITFAGDDVAPIFTVIDSAGAAVNISSVSNIQWYVNGADGSPALTLTKTGGQIAFVTDGTDGKFQVNISAANTTALPAGNSQHLARIVDALGNVTTVEVGTIRVGVKPTWTYNPAAILTTPLYQVRRYLGDVIENDRQMSDSEIAFFLSVRSTVIGAAAEAARSLAAQYSRKVDVTSPGELRTANSVQAKHYLDLADELDGIARSRGAGITPYAGGISVQDKINVQDDPDRVQPSFNIGMQDALIPVSPLSNETPTQTSNNPGP